MVSAVAAQSGTLPPGKLALFAARAGAGAPTRVRASARRRPARASLHRRAGGRRVVDREDDVQRAGDGRVACVTSSWSANGGWRVGQKARKVPLALKGQKARKVPLARKVLPARKAPLARKVRLDWTARPVPLGPLVRRDHPGPRVRMTPTSIGAWRPAAPTKCTTQASRSGLSIAPAVATPSPSAWQAEIPEPPTMGQTTGAI